MKSKFLIRSSFYYCKINFWVEISFFISNDFTRFSAEAIPSRLYISQISKNLPIASLNSNWNFHPQLTSVPLPSVGNCLNLRNFLFGLTPIGETTPFIFDNRFFKAIRLASINILFDPCAELFSKEYIKKFSRIVHSL